MKVFSAGESNIAAFAINPQTGEPTAFQHADIRAAHPRTFGLDASGRMMAVGALAPTAVRRDGKVVVIPAGITVFKVERRRQARFRPQIRSRRRQADAVVERDDPAGVSALRRASAASPAHMCDGSHSARIGNAIKITSRIRSVTMNGSTPMKIVEKLTSCTTLLMTKTFMPTGG